MSALGPEVMLQRCIDYARRHNDFAMLTLLGVDVSPVDQLIDRRLRERVEKMSKAELIAALTPARAPAPTVAKVLPLRARDPGPVAASPAPVDTETPARDPGPLYGAGLFLKGETVMASNTTPDKYEVIGADPTSTDVISSTPIGATPIPPPTERATYYPIAAGTPA